MSGTITIVPAARNEVILNPKPGQATVAASPSIPSNVPVSMLALGSILVGRLVANVGGKAVPYDVTQPDHAYALVGVAISSALNNALVLVQDSGRVTIPGWNLQPGQQYRAGTNGQLTTGPEPTGAIFSQVIGRAVSSSALQLNFQSIIFH